MDILKANMVYKEWENESNASELEKLIARALLATNDVSATMFITGSSFEQISEVYGSMQGFDYKDKHSEKRDVASMNEVEESKKRLDRKRAVNFVLNKLIKANEGMEVVNTRYNTLELKQSDGQRVKVKVSTSRDYQSEDPQKVFCSWHKENDKNITDFDYHIYVVEAGDSYKGLIFSTEDLQNHLIKKEYNNHFVNYYFHWHKNGKVTDERDTETPIDVTKYDADKLNWLLVD